MNPKSNKCDVKKSVAVLKTAYLQGRLREHPSNAAIATEGHEVLASWGPMMRK
jgi:hypothetical protein